MYEDIDGVDKFNTHYDADRYNGVGGGRAIQSHRNREGRRIGPDRELELCVVSDYPPIPLAYKFEDGSPSPRY